MLPEGISEPSFGSTMAHYNRLFQREQSVLGCLCGDTTRISTLATRSQSRYNKRVFPRLFRLGPFQLPVYATLLSLGLVCGVLVSVRKGSRRGVASTRLLDAALIGVSSGLVGARAAYVAVNWAFFRHHLSEALRLWAGGLTWQGGLVSGLLLVALYGLRFRLSLGVLFDALTLGLACFTLFIWLGSGSANDVYGRETYPIDGFLWSLSADLPDLYGLRAPRINVPLLGAIWSGLVLGLLWIFHERLRAPGSLFLSYIALTGLGGVILVPMQANAVPYLFHVRLDWLFNLLLAVGGISGLAALRLRKVWQRRGVPPT